MSRGNASSPKGIHQGSSPWRGAKKIKNRFRAENLKNQPMDTNHTPIDSDALLVGKMKKMLVEGRSNEECLLEVARRKCLSESHTEPSEDEARIMLQEPSVRSFCFHEFARIRTALGF
ncbi:MAG: hypothetical protein Q4G08_10580 [Capnocytophaga sp.]|nr:hypothetical protein [Capnocytophaga sp.]